MIRAIWTHELTRKDIDEIAKAGFQMIIATKWRKSTYKYAKEKGLTLLRWVRDLEDPRSFVPYIKKSDGLVLDPESKGECAEIFYNAMPEHIAEMVVGVATWCIPVPIFKTHFTKKINEFYGIYLTDPVIVFDLELPNLQYLFPMAYPFKSFLATTRVKWMLDAWAEIKKQLSRYKVIPILQAFSRAELNEGEDEWKPSKQQLDEWVSYVTRKGFDGVSFFCWETYKEYIS